MLHKKNALDGKMTLLHPSPFLRPPLPEKMLLQAKEGLLPSCACKLKPGSIFPSCMIQITRESKNCKNLHPCLASKASLKTSKSRNPMPPLNFNYPILAISYPTSSKTSSFHYADYPTKIAPSRSLNFCSYC